MKSINQLTQKKRQTWCLLILMTIASIMYGQDGKTITGTVFDESGNQPLPGVNITLQGKKVGTTSDFDGNYTLQVQPTDVLVFSYIGFQVEKIPVKQQEVINVSMQLDAQQLDDVVVIGYGKQSRNLISSSVSKVKTEEVENNPSANAIQALQGKAAGLSIQVNSGQPGAAGQVYIRGGTQVNANSSANNPLYIIDGVYRTSLNGLNASDIETIQVLKDAASTAIYGARAGNGIILVTTKSGKRNTKGQVRVSYKSGLAQQLNTYPWTSAEDYIRVSRTAAERGINLEKPGDRLENTNFGYSVQTLTQRGQYGFNRNTLAYLDNLIAIEGQAYVSDLLENQGYQLMDDPVSDNTLIFKDNNYDDLIFVTAEVHDINLGFSGGSETGNYNVSLGYLDQQGTFLGTGFKRFSGLSNGSFEVSDHFLINSGVNFSYQESNQIQDARNSINRSSRLPHTLRLLNDDGTPALGESRSSPRNRLHEMYYQDIESKQYLTTLNLGAEWKMFEGFSFKPSVSFFRDESTFNFFERASPEIPDRASVREESGFNQLLLNGLLNYKKSFGEHHFDALFGVNYTKERREYIRGEGSNAPTDIISTINASATDQERVTSSIVENILFSNFGRISYDYMGKYLVSASYRNDGASQFAEENKFAFFPAFSLGWNVHQEPFWKVDFISKLKVRGSWGQAGSLAGLTIEDTQGQYGTRSYNFQGGALLSQLANTQLKWETTTTIDIGLDIGAFDNRLNFLVDYYKKTTEDRLIDRLLPQQTGFSSIRDNLGSIQNEGIEIEVGVDILKSDNFTWHTDFNYAYNKTKVVELPDNERAKNRIQGGVIYDPETGGEMEVGGLAEGERPYGIWAWDLIGVYATDEEAANAPEDMYVSGSKFGDPKNGGDAIWRDVNGDDKIDEKDLVFVGYQTPNMLGGMVNTFNYKGLQLRVAMDYAFGHVIANEWRARANGNARNNVMTTTDVLGDDFWHNQGDIAKYPRYDNASDYDNGYRNHVRGLGGTSNSNIGSRNGGVDNTLYFHKGDFVAFREVSLSYAFPLQDSKLKDLGLSDFNLSLSGYNLGYITAYDGLTPEIYDGVDEGIYPRPFQIILGLTVSF
ncbi:SusC/RagA family TonB-linked outer membrane protein [Galbibacter pacificus]|uniref:SusC/RagA family TonB-linked outer membrane protein n=1 Tax=Galbibacter pacificus TaxID=2996052 RepID=A0ABT6FMV8_9FLAO|nr:SusC/RagA family TonB-linked outer membrane protein [Galbibacter pacificus]MDG3581107.1 SusC/RagA family TonB-linked outer membrane protein [Galbibacter pacificus]MDG3584585.1 SusC/RagA family TonB-linked outer membrane protein [Galbibacter pacificus]